MTYKICRIFTDILNPIAIVVNGLYLLQTPSGDEVDRKSTINQEPAAATTVAAAEPVPAEPVLDESVPQETAEAGPEPEESVVPRLQLEEDEEEEDQLVVEEEPPLEQVSYINFRYSLLLAVF